MSFLDYKQLVQKLIRRLFEVLKTPENSKFTELLVHAIKYENSLL